MISPALRYARANNGITFRPDADTVLWLPGQDDAYSATIRDRSGNGNDGTITGATWAKTGRGLWYLSLDGEDDFVNIGATLIPASADFTLGSWVNLADYDKNYTVFSQWSSGTSGRFLFYVISPGGNLVAEHTGGSFRLTSGSAVGTGWVHVAMKRIADDYTVLINGVADGTDSSATALQQRETLIGADKTSSPASDLKGGMALERITLAGLSDSVILGHVNQERHLFGV